MKNKRFLSPVITAASLFLISSLAMAAPSADIIYNETDLGGGSWQYDYMFYNTSTSGESLYSVWFDFSQSTEVTGLPLPPGWDGTVWEGINTTNWINTYSASSGYDIAAENSLGWFSFTADYRAGSIAYTAYYDTTGGPLNSTGMTTVIPEPISSVLFLVGGALFSGRRYSNRKYAVSS